MRYLSSSAIKLPIDWIDSPPWIDPLLELASKMEFRGGPFKWFAPRVDGPPAHRFFAVRDGALYSGYAAVVVEDDVAERPVEDAELREPLQTLFGGFEGLLSTGTVVEQLDDETQEALRALGYAE